MKNNIKNNIRIGVNIDHVATLRNARKENFPSPLNAARLALDSGADSITAHLREDRRHINDSDIKEIAYNLPGKLNLEMAATDEMLEIAEKIKPFSCCIVPEKREEVTTEGGLDVINNHNKLKPIIDKLRDCGTLCRLYEKEDKKDFDFEFNKIKNFSKKLFSNGIEAHAGHGLNYETTKLVSSINEIEELNIGFFIIAESIFNGLDKTILTIKESMTIGRSLEE